MISSKVTHRYAKALLDLAVAEKQLDACFADMKLIERVCVKNSDLVLLLKSPIVNTDKKISIIN